MGRARRTWFKVASSLYREPWSRETKLTLVLLSAYLDSLADQIVAGGDVCSAP